MQTATQSRHKVVVRQPPDHGFPNITADGRGGGNLMNTAFQRPAVAHSPFPRRYGGSRFARASVEQGSINDLCRVRQRSERGGECLLVAGVDCQQRIVCADRRADLHHATHTDGIINCIARFRASSSECDARAANRVGIHLRELSAALGAQFVPHRCAVDFEDALRVRCVAALGFDKLHPLAPCAKKDNGILVMFSCNTCPYVIKNQQRTVAIGEYAIKMKVGVILLNSNEALRSNEDSYDAMKAYAKSQNYNWNYVVDKNNEVADAFGANRTPECFLFDKDLKLVYHGAIDDNPSDPSAVNKEHLKNAIDELIAGKEITVKESRSVGCSIKRKG